MAAATIRSASPTKENEAPLDAETKPNNPPSPTRSGTVGRGLSWQRRPNSQASERSRSRPLSVVAAENAARSSNSTPDPTPTAEDMTREQIASALSSKDPSWFRQTADRGVNSAAYRRNQVEDTQTVNPSPARTQLPGMSRSTSGESSKDEKSHTEPVALPGAVTSSINLPGTSKLDPPLDVTGSDIAPNRESREVFSPPFGRTSPTRGERPISPTKGAGGFVQSALMKRSDSVSKRWNVQSPAGLQRADSIASNRTSVAPKIRPKSFLREPSTESAMPSSSEDKAEEQSASVSESTLKLDTTTSPEPDGQDPGKTTPPVSPSKTMDPRRWSPQKSSWLESALNKPDSPKPKTQPLSNQPAWMVELQKAKAQKANNPGTESSNSLPVSHKHQVSIGGLMRSSAPGTTISSAGRGGLHSPSPSIDAPVQNVRESRSQTVSSLTQPKSESVDEAKQADTAPAINKVKPETPPKKDFRASLKPRAPPPSSSTGSQEVEFKNVFGNLRKTTTQNFVAPDELRDNITRGKAALTVTGGPQKSERKDEFKEAILAKKKEFQVAQLEGRGTVRHNSVSSEKPIPEGLLKRAELGRSNTIKQGSIPSDTPGADSRRPSAVAKPPFLSENSTRKPEHFSTSGNRSAVIGSLGSTLERQGVTPETASTEEPSLSAGGSADQSMDPNGLPHLQGKISGNLANRFNPALASLLAKGPPMASSSTVKSGSASLSESVSNSKVETNNDDSGSGPKLTHMTKNRARGPKRKAPTIASPVTIATRTEPSGTKNLPQDSVPVQRETPIPSASPEIITLEDSSKKESPAPTPPRPKPVALVGAKYMPDTTASTEIPTTPSKPEKKNGIHEQAASFAAQMRHATTDKTSGGSDDGTSKPPSPGKLSTNRMSRFADIATTESKFEQSKTFDPPRPAKKFLDNAATQDVEQKPQPRSPSINKPKVPLPESPLSRPKQLSPDTATKPVVAESEPKPSGLVGARPLPKPPGLFARKSFDPSSRPLPQGSQQDANPSPPPERVSSAADKSPIRSPTKQSADISASLRDFFGPVRHQRNYRADAAGLLTQPPNAAPPKIKTLSTQLFQFSSDGKKQPVPSHNERTLFEREMYLCVHSVINESGDKTVEVYFWAGDEVSESAMEDAAIFVSREARASGGTLIKLKQGKETPGFLQALGGIVIVQRGSGTKYDSLAPHMLCGRRYHGHVVFDEVDFTPSALCSGFPYLITQAGRCYLWKGKGSSVDELSCARLIGMDYALSGEMEEFDEGREPATFWDLFDGANRLGSADHWRLKPNYDKYCSRLFLSDAASQQQVSHL